MSPRGSGRGLDPDQLADLEDQRDFLLASIRDLEREHDAGDLEDDDYEVLRDEYTARAAEILRAIEEQREAFAENRRDRSFGRTALTFAIIIVIAAAAGVALARTIGARSEGQSATGSVRSGASPAQRAAGCQQMMLEDPDGAVECFEGVLVDDPRNVVASTWLAWRLELSNTEGDAAVAARVEGLLTDAVTNDPNFSQARAFRAIVAFRHGDSVAADLFLADFDELDAPADSRRVIEQFELRERIAEQLDAIPAEEIPASRCRARFSYDGLEAGLECFKDLLAANPDDVPALISFASTLETSVGAVPDEVAGDLRVEVESLLDRALEIEPENFTALTYRAIVALNRQDVASARTFHERILALDPSAEEQEVLDNSGIAEEIERLEGEGATTATSGG